MPRPLSATVMELSAWIETVISSQNPASASSIELSTTSYTKWCRPFSPVDPMYMPGRLRTASRPLRTVMDCASYCAPFALPFPAAPSPAARLSRSRAMSLYSSGLGPAQRAGDPADFLHTSRAALVEPRQDPRGHQAQLGGPRGTRHVN